MHNPISSLAPVRLLSAGPLVALCAVLMSTDGLLGAKDLEDKHPPFPDLFDWRETELKIVSESVDDQLGTQINEEYHDISEYKSAYRTTRPSWSDGRPSADYRMRYVEPRIVYSYWPYKCKVTDMSKLSGELYDNDEEPNWNFNTKVIRKSQEMHFFGVYGLWQFARNQERVFKRVGIIYSASRETHVQALMWEVYDHNHNTDIRLYFIDHSENENGGDNKQKVSLEMIEIVRTDSTAQSGLMKRIIRTINILSIEHSLSEEVRSELLEPPVGFGCFSSLVEEGIKVHQEYLYRDWNLHSLHIELEVTATSNKLLEDVTDGPQEEHSSDTQSVELARTQLLSRTVEMIEMIRRQSSLEDKKLVINHMLRVVYSIDMLKGSCVMSHVGPLPTITDGRPVAHLAEEVVDEVLLRFENGLELEVSARLFHDPSDIHYIKRTPASAEQPEMLYYEGGTNEATKRLEKGDERRVRTIYTYTKEGQKPQLHSVTIWVLNEQQNRLLEIYQVNLIDAHELTPVLPDEVKLFDVSDECYLENEQMVQNRDYAWFQLTYPAPRRILDLFASNLNLIKRSFSNSITNDFSQLTNIEFIFEEDSFIIRALMLDTPPTELIFDQTLGQVLKPDFQQGDLNYQAPDLKHCGQFCRMNHCTVMSFCSSTRVCLLSTRNITRDIGIVYSANPICNTYKIPMSVDKNQILSRGLHSTIARLQHQNYGMSTLPKVPDEISMPRSETGLSQPEYKKALSEYESTLYRYLRQEDRMPELALITSIKDHYSVLVPSKFELESDPLREFNIFDETSNNGDDADFEGDDGAQSDGRVPRFHQGMAGARYNLAKVEVADGSQQIKFHQFSGLTYDQCAMACVDSRCGSFSFCDGHGDCILSNINNTGRAASLKVVQPDPDCFIAQRDFITNFIRFESIYRPQTYAGTSGAADASECALNCVAETSFKCLSFEFCRTSLAGTATTPHTGQCYYQMDRFLPASSLPANSGGSKQKPASNATKDTNCDHYSRSYLADFVRVEFRRVAEPILSQLKTSTMNGVSVFSCAERCANEILDCSAFQFCHQGPGAARVCTTIESKIKAQQLNGMARDKKEEEKELETVVDESDGGQVLHAGKYLEFDAKCQVFAMDKEASEAHLRDLAFGGLITTKRAKDDEGLRHAQGSSNGAGLSFLSGFFLYILVTLASAVLGCVAIILRENPVYVRQHIYRVRSLLHV